MYPLKKGKTTNQAHVGLPEGTFEEEHGRKGFYGKSAHLYHAHPPTGWIRFEGKLRPHCFDLNQLTPRRSERRRRPARCVPGKRRHSLSVSRRTEPMPFYFRNADGDELYFVHRGHGKIETDFGPLDFEPGDYINIPRAVTYRIVPETRDNFFLIIQSKHEFEQPEKGLLGQHALYDPAAITTPEPAPLSGRQRRMGSPHQGGGRDFEGGLSVQSHGRGRLEGRPDGVEDQHARHSAGDEPSRPSAPQRAYHVRHRRRRGVQLPAAAAEEDEDALRVPFFHRNTDYDEFIFYHDGDFFSKDNIKAGMATLHPRGIHHGPHPKALANQKKKTHTDEYAVMLDGLNPIHVLPAGEDVEWKDYWTSWMEKKPVETR